MTKTLPLMIAGAAMLCGSAAGAQMPAKQTSAKTVATSRTTTSSKPAMATSRTSVKTSTATTAKGRMVTTKTSTGKTVTYDCSKAGNATKTACKK